MITSGSASDLSSLTPLPGPLPLPPDYRRHDPSRDELRAAVSGLVAGTDWPLFPWSELVDQLLAVGRTDVGVARLAEGHIDALRTLAQVSRTPVDGSLYGVWASRSGATGVRAEPVGDAYRLSGTLKFASGAGLIDRALVPIWVGDHHLLADLAVADLPVDATAWVTSAMTVSRSHTVDPQGVEVAVSMIIGPEDFYLDRLGFFPGGVGVAAVWAGGLARLVDLTLAWLDARTSPAVELRLGALRAQLVVATAVVQRGGRRLDVLLTPDGIARTPVDRAELHQLATEVRSVVGTAVRAGINQVRELAGPAGLAFAADLTHAVDDLDLYVRQQNADGDAALLGRTWRP